MGRNDGTLNRTISALRARNVNSCIWFERTNETDCRNCRTRQTCWAAGLELLTFENAAEFVSWGNGSPPVFRGDMLTFEQRVVAGS